MNLSVIILCENEQAMLPQCLASITWCDDIHVVDSGSIDRTVELAQEAGAKTYHRAFTSFGDQRNWALGHCDIQHDWILFLDADERSTDAFAAALDNHIRDAADDVAGFCICWRLMLYGRWLKFSGDYPNWQFRIARRGRARFIDVGHGQKEGPLDGRLEYIREPIIHEAFARGWSAWYQRHDRYSDIEAALRLRERGTLGGVFRAERTKRNAALKLLLTRVPGWPVLRFVISYFLKLGFLDGWPGLIICLNWAWYEYTIKLKMSELWRREKGLPI